MDLSPMLVSFQRQQIGWLYVGKVKYPIFIGINKLGRCPVHCNIPIPNNTVSKIHAEIETDSERATIRDVCSLNKIQLNDVKMEPQISYALENGASLKFGTVSAKYYYLYHVE